VFLERGNRSILRRNKQQFVPDLEQRAASAFGERRGQKVVVLPP
jgi:hypothetical protein